MKTVTRTVLYADEGMALTKDGVNFCKAAYLAEGADASPWREVPEEEAKESEGEML